MIRAINYQQFSKFVKVTELTSKILSVLFLEGGGHGVLLVK